MKKRQQLISFVLAMSITTLVGYSVGYAQDRTPLPRVKRILTQSLDDIPGREVRLEKVTFPPKATTPPHRHPGHVFVYVLEGTVESALEDGDPQKYTQGQSFYEPTNGLHAVTRNPSESEEATILTFMIMGEKSPSLKFEPRKH